MANAYPTRPVRLMVGFPSGGASDIVARIIGEWLSDRLAQSVIIENKPGAGSSLAFQAVATAVPDGYTLLFVSTSTAINVTFYETQGFNFLRDIAAVAGIVRTPLVMEVKPSFPAHSVADFIAYAKANPGKINMASFGVGTISHLASELFKTMTSVNVVHVPYRGGAPMVADLLGGQVDAGFDALPSSLPYIQSDALRALAVTTATRSDMLPDLPTLADTVTGYEASTWSGVGAPRGTPPEIIERLNREINAGLADSNVKGRFAQMGTTPIPFTPAEFGTYMATEVEKWGSVIKLSGVKPN
jgi:tripartite-type tricarboxylate transporter receptor subunit TctC